MMKFPTEWKVIKFHGSMIDYYIPWNIPLKTPWNIPYIMESHNPAMFQSPPVAADLKSSRHYTISHQQLDTQDPTNRNWWEANWWDFCPTKKEGTCDHPKIPSGYLCHSHGKSTMFNNGKASTISMGHLYHGELLNNQWVTLTKSTYTKPKKLT